MDVPCPACQADPCVCPPIPPEQMPELLNPLTPEALAELERVRAERDRPTDGKLH